MELNTNEVSIIKNALSYFIKHDIPSISKETKTRNNISAQEAHSKLSALSNQLNAENIRIICAALSFYVDYMSRSALPVNPEMIDTTDSLTSSFEILIDNR